MKKLLASILLKTKKHSPEICLIGGISCVVAGTVIACKRTLTAKDILEQHNKQLEEIEEAKEEADDGEYPEEIEKKDRVTVYTKTAVAVVKHYALPASLFVGGIGLICGSYAIMRKRNALLMASFTALEACFEKYRDRVKEKYGEDVDDAFYHGYEIRKEDVTYTDEKGKEKTKKEDVVDFSKHEGASQYAKFFDESSKYWTKDPDANMLFLKGMQNMFNDRLKAKGHVFLNEVYDALDIPETPTGALCGWVEGNGDDFIDFGIFDENNIAKRRFVNGYERNILLDFNVDGIIYNLI